MKGKLVLEDGAVFYGDMLDERPVLGEVVFNTGMTGYQEILTDPSYCSQIVTLEESANRRKLVIGLALTH